MKILKNHIVNTLISKFLVAFCSMGIIVITSKVLGSEGRGLISYTLLVIAITQVLAEFAGGSAIINLAPKEKLINLMVPSYGLVILMSLALFGFLTIYQLPIVIAPWLASLICLLMCLSSINLSIILGREQINKKNGIQFIYTVLLLSGVYYVYWLEGDSSVIPYFEILAFSYGVGWVLSVLEVLRISKSEDFRKFEWSKQLFNFGFWSQLSQLVNMLNYRMAYFFVEDDFGMAKLGVFSNAINIGDKMKIAGQSLGQVQHNRIINHSQPVSFGKKITARYMVLNILLYALQWAAILLLPIYFWVWLLGADFESLKQALVILLPGFVALGLATSYSYYYHAINKFKTVLFVNILTLLTLIGVYHLIKDDFGFQAVLYAFSAAYISQLLAFIIIYHKEKNSSIPVIRIIKLFFKSRTNKG